MVSNSDNENVHPKTFFTQFIESFYFRTTDDKRSLSLFSENGRKFFNKCAESEKTRLVLLYRLKCTAHLCNVISLNRKLNRFSITWQRLRAGVKKITNAENIL